MNEIFENIVENENIKIIGYDNSLFKIEFKYSAYSIINSIIKTRIIKGASTDSDYKSIIFKAKSVETLSNFIKKDESSCIMKVVSLLYSLSVQLNYLISVERQTIIGYSLEDIIVINGTPAFFGSELVAKIDEVSNMAMISFPFLPTDFFASPEILKITHLPTNVHFKTSYFSLGLLIIYILLGNKDFYYDYLKDKNTTNLLKLLNNHSIYETKLYWLLSRCLIEDAKERSIILF